MVPSIFPFSSSSSATFQYSQVFLHVKKNATSTSCFSPVTTSSLFSPSQSSYKRMSCLHLESRVRICSLSTCLSSTTCPHPIRLFHPHHSRETTLAKVGNGLHFVKSISLCPLTSMKHAVLWTPTVSEGLTS